MSDKNITVDINNSQIEEPRWCQIALINIICAAIIIVSIICSETVKVKICFVLFSLAIFVVLNLSFYLCHLHYKTIVYNSTMSVVKTIMALEKQKEHSSVQFAKIEKITLDGKVLISIDWPKNTNQNNSNQSNEKLGK